MDKIIEQIKSNRPSLSPSSLKTYSSTLKNIYFKIFGSTNDINYSFFNKTEPIIQYLSTKNPSSRKSALSALFVFTELPIYREAMNKDINEYNNQVATQEKNDKQKDYWLSKEELQNVYERVKKEALRLFRNKTRWYRRFKSEAMTCPSTTIIGRRSGGKTGKVEIKDRAADTVEAVPVGEAVGRLAGLIGKAR